MTVTEMKSTGNNGCETAGFHSTIVKTEKRKTQILLNTFGTSLNVTSKNVGAFIRFVETSLCGGGEYNIY